MYIKSVSIEGFKSYGNRVVVNGFDPAFNAITGLNGSGKSNILDSICFALGLSRLDRVRATNTTELVYKNGQAGINKAQVTITFDNSDPSLCPVGYELHRDITVTRIVTTGGKNKYLINGVNVNTNRLSDFFQSVNLNINNPHFLIMQGRITTVLNMKPLEILSMVEEAAGTKMYETKKEFALKNIEKKDSKIKEIECMLNEHICPQLEKLKQERKEYTEFSRITRDYEKLSKIYVAWDYTETSKIIQTSEEEKEQLKKKCEDLIASIAEMKRKVTEADKHVAEMEQKMDTESGNKLHELEEKLKKLQVSETKADTGYKNKREAANEEKKKYSELVKNLKEDKETLALKQKELESFKKKLEDLNAEKDKDREAFASAENHFHAVNAGLSGEDGEEASLATQLIAANKDKKDAETEAKSIEMALKHMKSDLEKWQSEIKKVDKSYSECMDTYKTYENDIKKLKNEISKLKYDEEKFENLTVAIRQLLKDIEDKKDALDNFFARNPEVSFNYTDPVQGFDRSKVFGPLCLEVKVLDPTYCLALDMAAAGKLKQIIVDNEQTGKLLLSRGNLRQRVTMIPLNKITSHCIDNKTLANAEHIGGKGNIVTALSCVKFDPKLAPAMQYAFGDTFICKDMEVARNVSYAEHIRKRCVTLDGEVYSPSGTLSGGSMQNMKKLLQDLAPIAGIKKEIADKQIQLNDLQNKMHQIKEIKVRYESLCEQCELKENEARLLKSKIEHSTHHKQLEEFERLQKLYDEKKNMLAECKVKQTKSEKLIVELEAKTSKSTREDKIKEAEKNVLACKKRSAASQGKYNAFLEEVSGLRLEIEGIEASIPELEEAIRKSNENIESLENVLKECDAGRKEIKDAVANLMKEVKSHKEMMKAHSSEISKISKGKEEMIKEIGNAELQIQQLEHDIKNTGDNVEEAIKKRKYLLDNHRWIEGQKKYFGVPNSEYDFESFNPRKVHAEIKELESKKQKMSKNVNVKAQNMQATVEEEFKNLLRKKDIVMKDRQAIEQTIHRLDEETRSSLVTACKQVNKDFGSIFSSLLPGSSAKLEPPPGKTVLDGLEFKVAFGGVWKESLNELSGGQRSLVALSLVLALLLFKPAPIYILDEVDAALDLSHTQNIGKMLKMHFQKSQFIIVSLKEGMFSNANVLFRTQFNDGMSSVVRHLQKQ